MRVDKKKYNVKRVPSKSCVANIQEGGVKREKDGRRGDDTIGDLFLAQFF